MEAGRSNPLMVIQMENIPRGLQSVSLIGINYITGVSGPVSWQLRAADLLWSAVISAHSQELINGGERTATTGRSWGGGATFMWLL